MPEVVYYAAASLDGFIATPDGRFDWLSPYPLDVEDYGYKELIDSIDSALMGRKTYEQVAEMGEWPYGDTPMYVFSRKALDPVGPSVTITSQSPRDVMAEMDRRGLRRAWLLGGGELASSFRKEGLISEWILSIMPVILGGGIPLVAPGGPIEPLKLTATQAYPSGVVQLKYARMA